MNNSIDFILSQLTTQSRILEIVSSLNGRLTIEETEQYRWIRDNHNAYYSILDKFQCSYLVLPYLQTMMAALLFVAEPKSILVLGAGGGALLRFFSEYKPNSQITAIDHDELIIQITNKYFLSDNLNAADIIKSDAYRYLENPVICDFDLVFIDLFAHGDIPDLFNKIAFYEKCKIQSKSGVVIFNLIINDEFFFKKIFNTLLTVFDNRCLCLTVSNYKNIIVLAFSEGICIQQDITELRNVGQQLNNLFSIDFDVLIDEIVATNICDNNILQF